VARRTLQPLRAKRYRSISDIPDAAIRFLRTYITSVTQLETLLLLRKFGEREWSAAEISKELYTNEQATSDMLESLDRAGLVKRTKLPGAVRYRYAPDGLNDRAIALLERCYGIQRVRIIDLIFSSPRDQLQSFAQAFKLKPEGTPE
jgi:DNA-binding MarR family transcriptional regulator